MMTPCSQPALASADAGAGDISADRITILDSHTAGEPTRLVLSGGPALQAIPLQDRLAELRERFPGFRTRVVAEPRGSDVIVGALLCPAEHPGSLAGVIFFNDVGYLGMCGHGTIGLIHSLAHLERISPGEHRIDTPAGTVQARLHEDGAVTVTNVESYRLRSEVSLDVPELGRITGDIAWGGNWFFLIRTAPPLPLELEHVRELTRLAALVRQALQQAGIAGPEGELIDHIEWFSAPVFAENDSRNFVLCPGAAYDRSPCGTGTSAKLACLAADGLLAPGAVWRQEGILGTVFTASYEPGPGGRSILPSITGRAWITAEATLVFDPGDPFAAGIASL